MVLKTSLLSTVAGLLGRTEERRARAVKGDGQLVFLCSMDTLTLPSPPGRCRLMYYWVPHLFPEKKSRLKKE